MALTDAQKLAVAEAFVAAMAANDSAAMAALGAPDARTWHNHDDLEVSLEQTAQGLKWIHRAVPDLAWETRSMKATSDGFIWQSVLVGTAAGGRLRCHSCVVVTLDDDGLVRRIEEYLDPSQTRVLRG